MNRGGGSKASEETIIIGNPDGTRVRCHGTEWEKVVKIRDLTGERLCM
jgi:hypothetical protein